MIGPLSVGLVTSYGIKPDWKVAALHAKNIVNLLCFLQKNGLHDLGKPAVQDYMSMSVEEVKA